MGEFEVDMDARLRMTATLGTKNAAPPFYTRVYLQGRCRLFPECYPFV